MRSSDRTDIGHSRFFTLTESIRTAISACDDGDGARVRGLIHDLAGAVRSGRLGEPANVELLEQVEKAMAERELYARAKTVLKAYLSE